MNIVLTSIYQSAQVKPWLLFCCDEEVGGLGAKAFCIAYQQHLLPNELDGLKFIIELDRKGKHDAVFYRCANPDFEGNNILRQIFNEEVAPFYYQ